MTVGEFLAAPDKRQHMLGSAALVLAYRLYGGSLVASAVLVLVIGALKELVYDDLLKFGDPEWLDFVADALGVAVATLIALGAQAVR